MFKVLSQQLQGTLTMVFERHPTYSCRFYGRGSTYVLILSWVNIMKPKWMKVRGKLSVRQKSEPVLRRTLHQDISRNIAFFFFSRTSLVFIFSLLLTE